MNRFRLLIAITGGTAILSFAQLGLAADTGADVSAARDAQYKVALARCDAGAGSSLASCRAAAKAVHDTVAAAREDGIPTDAQGRLQFDP